MPESNVGGNLENLGGRRYPPDTSSVRPVFQIPLSQDILAHGATQDISVGFSQPGRTVLGSECTLYSSRTGCVWRRGKREGENEGRREGDR